MYNFINTYFDILFSKISYLKFIDYTINLEDFKKIIKIFKLVNRISKRIYFKNKILGMLKTIFYKNLELVNT